MTKNILLKEKFFELWIALRYTQLKNKNHFISFISLTSIIGIALGVMALIVVLSVMNGFQSELKSRILNVASDVEIISPNAKIRDWQAIDKKINSIPNVNSAAPFTNHQALVSMGKYNRGVLVRGIDPSIEPKVSNLHSSIVSGSFNLIPNEYQILIGIDLARYFSLKVGDKISMISSQANYSPVGMLPRIKQYKISGIFDAGMYEYDAGLVVIHINDAQKFFQTKKQISGVRVKLNDLDFTKQSVSEIYQAINSEDYIVLDWTQKHANLFSAIQLEKRVMSIILTLIIAVAAFNIVSTLVMGVTEKKSDIAILRTLGASQKSILIIFMGQGALTGIIGTFFGILFGVLIATNIDIIVPFIENIFGIEFLSKDIYYISEVPSQILLNDIFYIGFMGLLLSFIASIYPSFKASKIEPAVALKYE
ncbi:MAG: lipoprotein-releasing ABC transporter permease subunit [Methylophilaceae bacterium]